jgi:AbrB family looped-hinge helix DNA binding protein
LYTFIVLIHREENQNIISGFEGQNWEQAGMCNATISSRYQITIPKKIRERFDIKPGDKAVLIARGKSLEIVFARSDEELEGKMRSHSKTSEFFSHAEV